MNNTIRSPHIGTLNEGPLHEAIKKWYARPRDRFEVPVEGSVADIVRGKLLIEIQTRNFSAIRRKLDKLLKSHKVRLVYPIAAEKWIIKQPRTDKDKATRRRSPRRGTYEDIFLELIRIPYLLAHDNFSIELLLIKEEEVRRYDGVKGWRRGFWVTEEHRLLEVAGRKTLKTPKDLGAFLPVGLGSPFTTTDLSKALGRTLGLAQKMVYCLKAAGCLKQTGKKGNSILYSTTEDIYDLSLVEKRKNEPRETLAKVKKQVLLDEF